MCTDDVWSTDSEQHLTMRNPSTPGQKCTGRLSEELGKFLELSSGVEAVV